MHCTRIKLPGGGVAIVCGARPSRKRCTSCGRPSGFQCDWKLPGGKTCDRHLCGQCAQEVAPEKHLCPEHQAAYRHWLPRRAKREIAALMHKAREHQAASREPS